MPEDATTPGPSQSIREALGLPPDADEAAVAAARARLIALFDDAAREAAAAPAQGPSAEELAPAGEFDPLEEIGEGEDPPVFRRRSPQQGDAASGSAPRGCTRAEARRKAKKLAPLLTIGAVAAFVVAVQMGGSPPAALPDDHPAVDALPTATATAPAVDAEAVLAQLQLLAADPNSTAALQALADFHFAGEDFASAASWLEKLVALTPEDAEAHLMLGVARFYNYDLPGAEEAWLRVLEIDPEHARAYYNLGFLHLSKDPADTAAARAAWERVLELAPDSDMAKTVATHLGALEDPEGD